MIVHGAGSYDGSAFERHTTWPMPFSCSSVPVGAAGIRHARERDRLARDPVEVVGDAEVAEEPGVRAGREHAQLRHARPGRAHQLAKRSA